MSRWLLLSLMVLLLDQASKYGVLYGAGLLERWVAGRPAGGPSC